MTCITSLIFMTTITCFLHVFMWRTCRVHLLVLGVMSQWCQCCNLGVERGRQRRTSQSFGVFWLQSITITITIQYHKHPKNLLIQNTYSTSFVFFCLVFGDFFCFIFTMLYVTSAHFFAASVFRIPEHQVPLARGSQGQKKTMSLHENKRERPDPYFMGN